MADRGSRLKPLLSRQRANGEMPHRRVSLPAVCSPALGSRDPRDEGKLKLDVAGTKRLDPASGGVQAAVSEEVQRYVGVIEQEVAPCDRVFEEWNVQITELRPFRGENGVVVNVALSPLRLIQA